jgi:lysozyme
MTRPVPARARALIADYEKDVLTLYDDGVGIVTGGRGHVVPGGKIGTRITQRQSDMWFEEDLQIAARRLERKIGAEAVAALGEGQYGAMVSFVFNLGTGGSSPEWKIWGFLRRKEFAAVPDQIKRFNRAGGKVLRGLERRRQAEVNLWLSDGPEEAHVPSSVTRVIPTPPAPEATVKPMVQSKTMWAGATVAVSGVAEGARQVQALVAPQAYYSEYLAKLGGIIAGVIVAAGIAIMVFKYLDARKAKH